MDTHCKILPICRSLTTHEVEISTPTINSQPRCISNEYCLRNLWNILLLQSIGIGQWGIYTLDMIIHD